VDQAALDLESLLVESWVVHHGARRLKQLLEAQQRTNRQYLELTELRLGQGQGSALDVLQQKGRLVTTAGTLPGVDEKRRRAANAYAVLMGRLPDGSDLVADGWPDIEPLSTITSPRQLLDARPDLQAAFLALGAADHEVAAAIADRLPRLSIGVTMEQSGRSLTRIGDGSIYQVAGGLLAPVFDAGRLKAKAAQRKAEALETLAILEQAMRTAVREVEDALVRETALFEELSLLQAENAIALDTVKEATRRYVNGQESFLSVLAALVKQQTLQQNEIALQQDLLINRGLLLKALGAKWSQ
jgi:outer membrane protein TolC